MSYNHVTFEDADQFTYPLNKLDYDGYTSFPMLQDSAMYGIQADAANAVDTEASDYQDEVLHPVVTAIRNGGKIESLNMINEWDDDHCPCVDCEIVVNGKKYGFSAWWLSREGYKMFIKAETLKGKAFKEFVEFVLSHGE